MKFPAFTPLDYEAPLKLAPLDLKPMEPLQIEASLALPQEVLDRLGVKQPKQESRGGVLDIFGCQACGSTSN